MRLRRVTFASLFTLAVVAPAGALGPARGNQASAVTICHNPGTPDRRTMSLPKPAADQHVKSHGDQVGPCEPREIEPTLDVGAAVRGTFSVAGGVLSTVDSFGRQVRLRLPPGALTQDTEVTLTPLSNVRGPAVPLLLLGGAHLEPSGLVLALPAVLELEAAPAASPARAAGFRYQNTGRDFHLAPVITLPNGFSLSLTHFSGGGVIAIQPGDCESLLEDSSGPLQAASGIAACATEEEDDFDRLVALEIEWLIVSANVIVLPALQAAENFDALLSAMSRWMEWYGLASELEAVDAELDELIGTSFDVAEAVLQRTIAAVNGACLATVDCGALNRLGRQMFTMHAWADVLGLSVEVDELSACGNVFPVDIQARSSYVTGETDTLVAAVARPDLNPSVTWASRQPQIARIDPGGVLAALTPGHADIDVTVITCGLTAFGSATIRVVAPEVDAFITISPLTGTVPIGGPHVLTARVEADAGAGLVSAPAGTMIDFAIVNGPGAFDAATCVTAGETGSCSVTMTSGLAGVTVIRAATTIVVGGVPLTRVTDGVGRNSASATVEIVQKDGDIDVAINPAVASLTVRTSIAISATNALGERVRATWESSDPQTVTITPVADGLLASVFAVRLDPPETARTVAISATVEDQSAVAHITVLPAIGGNRIRGRVWRDDGDRLFTFRIPNPGQRADVPGAFTGIRLVSTTGHVSRTTTDQTGRFVFANLDDGTYTITCEACETAHLAAWNRTSVTLPLSGWHGQDVILDFMAPLASIAAVPVDLGHLDNRFPGDGATATAINQSGHIVGRSQVYMPSVDVSGHPGHWRCQVSFLVIAGIMTSLGTQCPFATGISDHGSVVGTCYTRSGPPDPDVDSEFGPCGIPRSHWSQRAIWMPGGAPSFLGSTTDLGFQVQGVSVNGQGAVVGRDETGTFVWRDGTKSYLPVPGNFSPSDINRHGHVLGILDRAGMFPRRVPALWIAETGLIEFGHGNLEFREDLLVLNDDDRIVGFSALYAALFDRERRDGALLIGAFPSRGMNNVMHVVGSGGNAAVLWTPDTGPVLLPQLVPGQSCGASDVNDARQVAGACQVTSGQSHAVRWDYIIVEQ